MGNKTSKLSRSTPKSVQASSNPRSTALPRSTAAPVSFTKSDEISRDGADLHLDQMLRKLGPVRVPLLSTNFQPRTDNMLRILENRANDSPDDPSKKSTLPSGKNRNVERGDETRLKLTTIVEIVKAYHSIQEQANSQETAQNSTGNIDERSQTLLKSIDKETLNYLVHHFNTIDNVQLVKNPNPNQQDQPLRMATWSRSSVASNSSST